MNRHINRVAQLSDKEDLRDDAHYILVDSSSCSDNRLPANLRDLSPRIVIDHHRDTDLPAEDDNTFFWITDDGAAATAVIELLQESTLNIGEGSTDWLLAILGMAVHNDTNQLLNANDNDREAYAWISQQLPSDRLAELSDYPLPSNYFIHLGNALETCQRKRAHCVANIGQVRSTDSDDVSSVADLLIREEGITLVVVWAVIQDEHIVRISARSTRDVATPLPDFLRERFGEMAGAKVSPDGRGAGGARMNIPTSSIDGQTGHPMTLPVLEAWMQEQVFGETAEV